MTPERTASAIAARRRVTEQKLQQARDAVAWLKRHKTPVTYPAVARAAGVSRTFLYSSPEARTLIDTAISDSGRKAPAPGSDTDEPSWRERALNAEAALSDAHAEIAAQRRRMAILLGQIRDLEHDLSPEAAQGWPPRTRHSSSASASSPARTGPWKNDWKQPAPTAASPTGASPSSKPSSLNPLHSAEARPQPAAARRLSTSRICARR